MKRVSLLVFIIVSALFLVLSLPFMLDPSLYSPDYTSPTLYHQNPEKSGQYSQVRTEDVQSLMQELLDDPESIVLNVKLKNFEGAKEDFNEYKTKSRHFNTIVVSFNLNETTIGNFNRRNLKNMDTLERIINESVRLEEINRLEIRYRSENNPALLFTITYEGEAVYAALQKATAQLRSGEREMLEIGSNFTLNTSQYQEAGDILDEIVKEGRVKQQEREMARPQLNRSSFLISIMPSTGSYGDTLRVEGAITLREVPEVTLVLDSRDWMSLQPDANGKFSTLLPIGRIRGGEHVIFAIAGTQYSNLATFIVIPTDSEVTLETNPGHTPSKLFCSGDLRAGEIPVTDANVRIFVDDFQAVVARTNQTGFYRIPIDLSQGNHTIRAVFDDTAFPLNPSESSVQAVTIGPSPPSPLVLSVGAGVVILGFLGGIWYLGGIKTIRWKRVSSQSSPSHIPSGIIDSMQEPAESSPRLPALEDIRARYQNLFDSGEWSEAAFVLYKSLIGRLMPVPGVHDSSSLTPREFAALLAPKSDGNSIRAFVARYEEVRYQGLPLQQNDILLTQWRESVAVLDAEKQGVP